MKDWAVIPLSVICGGLIGIGVQELRVRKLKKKKEALDAEKDDLKKKIFDFQNGFEQFYTKEIPDEIGAEDVLDNVKKLGKDTFGGWCGNTDFILDFGKEVENEIRLDFEIDD